MKVPGPGVEFVVSGDCVNRRSTLAHPVKGNLTFPFTDYGTVSLLIFPRNRSFVDLSWKGLLFPSLRIYFTLLTAGQSVCPAGRVHVQTEDLRGSKDRPFSSKGLAVFQCLLWGILSCFYGESGFEANGTAQENESHETKALPMGKTKPINYDSRFEKRLA